MHNLRSIAKHNFHNFQALLNKEQMPALLLFKTVRLINQEFL
jgi:hypothetical protein